MKKALLISSLFFSNLFLAEEEECAIQNSTTEELTKSNLLENEINYNSIVYEFLLDLNSINEEWLSIIDQSKKLLPNENESEVSNEQTSQFFINALQFTKMVQGKTLTDSNPKNVVYTDLYFSNDQSTEEELNGSEPTYITIKYVITQNENNDDSKLWELILAILESAKKIDNIDENLVKIDTINQIANIINSQENKNSLHQDLCISVNVADNEEK